MVFHFDSLHQLRFDFLDLIFMWMLGLEKVKEIKGRNGLKWVQLCTSSQLRAQGKPNQKTAELQ